MAEHQSLKQQVQELLTKIELSINKHNVQYILPLLKWIIKKIELITISEDTKKEIKKCKELKQRPPKPLLCSRGEIWDAFLGYNVGSEQNGINSQFSRPVLIVQNNINNKRSPNVIIVPLTKIENRHEKDIESIKSKLRATEAFLHKNDIKDGEVELKHHSIILCQNIREINKTRLNYKITNINDELWDNINIALKNALGID